MVNTHTHTHTHTPLRMNFRRCAVLEQHLNNGFVAVSATKTQSVVAILIIYVY